MTYSRAVVCEFCAEAISWRGPAPFVFVPVPPEISAEIRDVARLVTYGWGVIPVVATVGRTTFKTSLFPRDGLYLVPVKTAVQRAEGLQVGQFVGVHLELALEV